ncbi:MAG: thermonuclease family protein [Deltaproteobacteria bacterium]|nr:thermonuclease family protein [Deltaproteobacteria bacterium]
MKNNALKTSDYQQLYSELSRIIDEGRLRTIQVVNELIINTYWKIGERLSKEEFASPRRDSSRYMHKLAADLEVDASALYRAVRFFNAYPEGIPTRPNASLLSWSSHVELLAVKDPKERLEILERAVEGGWTRNIIRSEVRTLKSSEKQVGPDGSQATHLVRPREDLHNYVGIVERVIDGNTLVVRIDLGFNVWRVEHIRLQGIDTAEIGTPQGKQAKQFVVDVLDEVPFVVLHTYKTDKYARYVADLFYDGSLKKKEQVFNRGNFLNQQLLDQGLAKTMLFGKK